jgi:casein kinase II subunit beta
MNDCVPDLGTRAPSGDSGGEQSFTVPDEPLSMSWHSRNGEVAMGLDATSPEAAMARQPEQRVSRGPEPGNSERADGRSATQRGDSIYSSGIDSEAEGDDTEEDLSWISWFCSLSGNEFFCEVDEEFIQDDFNLTGLSSLVSYYEYALDTILDIELPDPGIDERQREIIEMNAEFLYGLIHARYILTNRGLHDMLEKYNNVDFGRCPRVFCNGQPVLPVGQSDLPRTAVVKLFCPKCWDIYVPRSAAHSHLDGAFWGTTFPHLFLQTYPELVPERNPCRYVPRIFGFRVSEKSKQVQRNLGLIHQNPDQDNRSPAI